MSLISHLTDGQIDQFDYLTMEDKLRVAVYRGDEELVKTLLEEGADPNIKDESDWGGDIGIISSTPAVGEVSKLLLQHGARITDKNDHGVSPLMLVVTANTQECLPAVQFYLDYSWSDELDVNVLEEVRNLAQLIEENDYDPEEDVGLGEVVRLLQNKIEDINEPPLKGGRRKSKRRKSKLRRRRRRRLTKRTNLLFQQLNSS